MKKILTLIFLLICLTSHSTNYFVNNNSLTGDKFCTAIGSNSNNGLTKSTPVLTFKYLTTLYTFADNDTIFVDAGTYTSSVAGSFTQNFGYSFTKKIALIGAGNTLTTFDNNYCGIAGGYYFADISAAVTIKDMHFTKYASNVDGQCFRIGGTGVGTVKFIDVLADANGGSTKYATFAINSNTTITITGGGINCNGDASHGASGGIDVKGTTISLTVTNVSFINNYKSMSSTSANGAALNITTACDNSTTVRFYNCLFSGCFTDNDNASGGTIYQAAGILSMTDCIIEGSKTYQNSVKYGGVGYFIGGGANFTRCLFRNNSNIGGSTYGTIAVNGGALGFTDCKFENNVSDRGLDLYTKGGSITITNSHLLSTYTGKYSVTTYNGTITLNTCGSPTYFQSSGMINFQNNNTPSSFTTPTTPTYTGDCSSGIMLPIELLYFIAECVDKKIYVRWSTSSETNNQYFVIEKTWDPTEESLWRVLSIVDGAGNSNMVLNYEIEDKTNNGIDYYRLKQIDFDGKYTFSKIVFLKHCASNEKITIFPNPTHGELNILIYSNTHSHVTIEICDMIGKLLYDNEFITIDGEQIMKIKTGVFNNSGTYIIRIQKDNLIFIDKIVVY